MSIKNESEESSNIGNMTDSMERAFAMDSNYQHNHSDNHNHNRNDSNSDKDNDNDNDNHNYDDVANDSKKDHPTRDHVHGSVSGVSGDGVSGGGGDTVNDGVSGGGGGVNDGTSINSFRGGAAKIKFRVRQPSTGKFTHINDGGGGGGGGGGGNGGNRSGDLSTAMAERHPERTNAITGQATMPQKSWDIVRMLANPFHRNTSPT